VISDRVILHVNFLYGVFRTLRSQTWFIVLEEPPDVLGGLSSISRSLKVFESFDKVPEAAGQIDFFQRSSKKRNKPIWLSKWCVGGVFKDAILETLEIQLKNFRFLILKKTDIFESSLPHHP